MEIQPINITTIIVAVISGVSTIISAIIIHISRSKESENEQPTGKKSGDKQLKGENNKHTPRKIKVLKYIMFLSLIILIVDSMVIFNSFTAESPTTKISTTEVKITHPYDGAYVEIVEMVRGTSQKIPEEEVIWIVIFPHIVGSYYPQNDPADVQTNGEWSSLISIGIEEDVDKEFDILAVLADKNAQYTFNAYLGEAKGKETWPGLQKLPEGASIYDRITVTRE